MKKTVVNKQKKRKNDLNFPKGNCGMSRAMNSDLCDLIQDANGPDCSSCSFKKNGEKKEEGSEGKNKRSKKFASFPFAKAGAYRERE